MTEPDHSASDDAPATTLRQAQRAVAESRPEPAESRTEPAESRTERAQSGTDRPEPVEGPESGRGESGTERGESYAERGEPRTERAESRTERAESRTERWESRPEPAESRPERPEPVEGPESGRSEADADGQTVHPDLVGELSGPLEALLLMAEEAMSTLALAQALQAPTDVVEQALVGLQTFYDETGRGFELRRLAGGWRYWTRDEHAEVISRAVLEGQQSRLSQAALETLAVVAYLQPVSRARISAVRGVNVDGVVRTLVTREMIEEAGQDPVSGAVVFRTTDAFCERIGLESLDQLPDLAPHLPDASVLEAELGQLATLPAAPSQGTPSQGTPDPLPDEPAAGPTSGTDETDDHPPAPAGGTEGEGRP